MLQGRAAEALGPDRRQGRRGRPSARWCGGTSRPARCRRAARRPHVPAGAAGRGRAAGPLRAGAPGGLRAARGRRRSVRTASRCRGGGRSPMRCSASATRGRRRPCSRSSRRRGATRRRSPCVAWPRPRRRSRRPPCASWSEQPRDAALMIQAIRALAALGDRASLPLVTADRRRPAQPIRPSGSRR